MFNAGYFLSGLVLSCLVLLANLWLVSGLCSRCLQERCYDNGECIIGCVSGYVGKYCSEACPSKCLNKVCHRARTDGAVTCTDGCEHGNCGNQCSEPCPRDCVTCDRQCGSCNVTLCPERRYGANCSEVCSPEYGKCDRETGQCIICRRGYYGDECTRECTTCFTRAETIIDSCLSGCKICQTEESCPNDFHGVLCERKCSSGCLKPGGCNRVTGECSIGCVSGYYGLGCNFKCSEHCLSGICNRATAECSTGCVAGYYGVTCNKTCNKFCVGEICNLHNGICTTGCVTGYISNLHKCDKPGFEVTVSIALNIVLFILVLIGIAVYVFLVTCWLRQIRLSLKKGKTDHGENGMCKIPPLAPCTSQAEDPIQDSNHTADITEALIDNIKGTETVLSLPNVRRQGHNVQRTEQGTQTITLIVT